MATAIAALGIASMLLGLFLFQYIEMIWLCTWYDIVEFYIFRIRNSPSGSPVRHDLSLVNFSFFSQSFSLEHFYVYKCMCVSFFLSIYLRR